MDDNGVVAGYEVTRDGVVLGVWDALSLVATDLSPGTDYVYGVTAIDNAGQRSDTSTVTLSTVFAPTDLRAAVYSSTAAEIFWNRSATRGLRYKVLRDGDTLGETDGTSWFDATLNGGTTYLYEVFAYDATSRRSERVGVTLTTPPNASPSASFSPANLTAAVYSSTAAEIFWDRSRTFGMQYEVQRDGVVLDTIGGISWFDATLSAGTSYAFQVVAIDSSGNRSTPAGISLTTHSDARSGTDDVESPITDNPFTEADPNAESAVAQLGYPAIRDEVDDLVSMSYLSLYYDNEADMMSVLYDEDSYDFAIDCPGGGTVSGAKGAPRSFFADFDACVFNGVMMSGHIERTAEFTVYGAGDAREYSVSFDDFSIDAGDSGTLLITGTTERIGGSFNSGVCGGPPTRTSSTRTTIASARWETTEGVTSIDNATWMQSEVSTPTPSGEDYVSPCYMTDTLSFEGAATLESATLGPQTAVLAKQGEIVSDDSTTSTEAFVQADFGDGSTLAVTAISESESRVDIVAEGIAVSFIEDHAFEARDDIPGVYE